jgi:hypothetical protein
MKLDEIGYLKNLPTHKRSAIVGFSLFVISDAIVISLFHFLGGVSLSDTISYFVALLLGALVWGIALWFWGPKILKIGGKPKQRASIES